MKSCCASSSEIFLESIWVNAKEYPVEQNGSTTYVARGKIKVTYSGTNCSANGKTATKDVNIRFVGNPGAVTITGYSNPATVTCGAKNITLTVAAAENATNYDWKNVPASWIGSRATTTNSATFQVDAGTEASNLTATARRSNVPGLNTSTSSSVTVKRPLPSITSSTPAIGTPISLCTPQQFVTASATGTNADSYVWTPQNGARINNSASPVTSASSVQVRAESADGSYTVRAYSTACQVASTNFESRTVFFGPATLDYGYYITNGLQYGMVESEDPPYPNAFCYTGVSMDANANVDYSRLVNKTWTKIAATPSTFPWAPNQWGGVGLTFKAANQSILFSITYGNNCNSTTKYFGFRSVNCFQALTVFPNPSAQDLVTVQLDNVENEEAIPTEISLYSEQSKQPLRSARPVDLFRRKSFKDNNKIEINVKDLPRGTYYLHVNHAKLVNKPVEKIRIVLD